jgi:hypothetical protein|tara:strand:- start:86 stop:250 length:165 start_codon:yes stop_codon:yes gene_type:complete
MKKKNKLKAEKETRPAAEVKEVNKLDDIKAWIKNHQRCTGGGLVIGFIVGYLLG